MLVFLKTFYFSYSEFMISSFLFLHYYSYNFSIFLRKTVKPIISQNVFTWRILFNALKFLASSNIFVCSSFFIDLIRHVDPEEEIDSKNWFATINSIRRWFFLIVRRSSLYDQPIKHAPLLNISFYVPRNLNLFFPIYLDQLFPVHPHMGANYWLSLETKRINTSPSLQNQGMVGTLGKNNPFVIFCSVL